MTTKREIQSGSASSDGMRNRYFASTRWTMVLNAAGGQADSQAGKALEELCRIYWYPLYAYVRRRGCEPEEAEDLTQAFFVHLLEKNAIAAARRERGRFRSFLLASLKNFINSEWRKASALKRGGGKVFSLDAQSAERRYRVEPLVRMTPDKVFERKWALQLLGEVMRQLQAEFEAAGQAALFEQLRFCLIGERSAVPYAQLAERLQMTENAVKVAVHRLRKRYRERLREEIAHTVARPEDVDGELRHLFQALAE